MATINNGKIITYEQLENYLFSALPNRLTGIMGRLTFKARQKHRRVALWQV